MREIDADIDWDHWRKADLWELEKACKLVYPKDPYSYKTKSSTPHRGRMPAHQDILNPDPRSRPAWANLYHLALDAVHAETLPYVLVKRGLYKLRSAEFFRMGADERRHNPSRARRYSIAAHRGMAVGGLRNRSAATLGRCCCSVLEGLRSEQTDNRSHQ